MIDNLKVETKKLHSMVKKLKKNDIEEVSFEFLCSLQTALGILINETSIS